MDPAIDPVRTCSREKWRNIPPGKSLFNAPPGKGLPIGNLTSQFFANLYLNPLDQFIKHGLKAKYYIRYSDDMILVHQDRHVLEVWRSSIKMFLRDRLLLELHPTRRFIRPVSNGADFVGYVVRPSHLLVRRRTVNRCKAVIAQHSKKMIRNRAGHVLLVFPPDEYQQLDASLHSYFGLFRHASTVRLRDAIFSQQPWLNFIFVRGRSKLHMRWLFPGKPANLRVQYAFFRRRFRGVILFQVGSYFELFDRDALMAARNLGMKLISPRPGFYARCGVHRVRCWALARELAELHRSVLIVAQSDMPQGSLKGRIGYALVFKQKADSGHALTGNFLHQKHRLCVCPPMNMPVVESRQE